MQIIGMHANKKQVHSFKEIEHLKCMNNETLLCLYITFSMLRKIH
jgi:hypothetical protein